MRELTEVEIDEVNGAVLANLGMGIAGALSGMAAYSLAGGISGQMTGSGFAGAAVGGFIFGAGGFNHVSLTLGTAAGAGVERYLRESPGLSSN